MSGRLQPTQALVLSFLLLILAGTFALQLPGVTLPGRELVWHEALFRSTSAVCVTGLSVRSPGDFTPFGQGVLLVLFQLGGIGILTFGLVFVVLLKGKMSFFGRQLAQGVLGRGPWEDFWPLLRGVIVVTLLLEALGTAFLAAAWAPQMGLARALGWGLYHSVSAFCNAGFGLHPDSIMPWQGNVVVVSTVGLLIVMGGLGFLPLTDLYDRLRSRRRRPLTLHTKMVLSVSGALLVLGTVVLLLFEWNASMAGLPTGTKILDAAFQSATPRTAGFSTLDLGRYTPASLLFTIMLMFIGASPGSTGGGVKTTTLGLLLAAQTSRARGERRVSAWGRSIPEEVLGSAVSLALSGLGIIGLASIVILEIERVAGTALGAISGFLPVVFEVVSAFGTVGLSTGITSDLLVPSRLVLVLLMFVGRVGPLTFGLAVAGRHKRREWRYPEESVMIG